MCNCLQCFNEKSRKLKITSIFFDYVNETSLLSVANAKAPTTMLEISEIIAGASARDLRYRHAKLFTIQLRWHKCHKCHPIFWFVFLSLLAERRCWQLRCELPNSNLSHNGSIVVLFNHDNDDDGRTVPVNVFWNSVKTDRTLATGATSGYYCCEVIPVR